MKIKSPQNIWNDIWSKGKYQKIENRITKANFKIQIFKKISSLPETGSLVVDLGCGAGFFSRRMQEEINGTVLGYDFSEEAIRMAEKYNKNKLINYCRKDLCVPFDFFHERADAVFLNGIIEHVYNASALMDSVNKLMNDNGRLYISSSNVMSIYCIEYFAKKIIGAWTMGLQRHYTPASLRRLLKEHGFSLIAIKTVPCVRESNLLAKLDRLVHLSPITGRYIFAVAVKEDGN